MAIDVLVPDLGDFKDVEVIDVLVKPGDTVEVDTPLITLETEKATMDVPSTSAGTVKSVAVKKGDRVSTGSLVLTLEPSGEQRTTTEQEADTGAAAAPTPPAAQPAARDSEQAGGEETITVPDLGDFKDVEVIDVLVKPGNTIEVDTPLITLETEKATMDVPATAAGVVKSVAVKKGDRVSQGDPILTLEARGKAAAPAQPAATPSAPPAAAERAPTPAAPTPAAPERPPATTPSAPAATTQVDVSVSFSTVHASPSVRKFARELGADLRRIKGTGYKGRITADDVKAWVKQTLTSAAASGAGLPKIPEVDFSKFGQIEVKPLGRIQKISGPRLHASWLNIPHVWQMDEADITELEETRNRLKRQAAERGIKLTPLAFIMRACVKALQEFPVVNSSLDPAGQNLIMKKYIHLGFAADTPQGLVVPVIRDADKKDVYELAQELATLSEKARAGKLSAAEMQGASFTISSLGGIGGTSFTPIINAPEVAILGVARASMRPVWREKDNAFVPRLILPFTFAYDHRVIDGALGARFTTFLAQQLANVSGLLEAVP
nr:dihydrolipoyllysine-residue acetyltransferase [Gammaproteobacteria bacterium]